MFTGLVQGTGAVEGAGEGRLRVATPLGAELAEGDSVAVNGVCLTATDVGPEGFSADVMPETLRRASLNGSARVNLELPLRACDRLGGHIVQGHVDGVAEVASVAEEGNARVVRLASPPELLRYVVAKGSIAVDGVSLTVAAVHAEGFSIWLIPETLERTNLGALARGASVNVEVDMVAKYVEKLVVGPSARCSPDQRSGGAPTL
ncbi:MAG: riboflavin synthase [Actinomycetota bacterium]|nr:riboflavin synthase [Actinomycetota bacterium]